MNRLTFLACAAIASLSEMFVVQREPCRSMRWAVYYRRPREGMMVLSLAGQP